jgi:hypothetical protein
LFTFVKWIFWRIGGKVLPLSVNIKTNLIKTYEEVSICTICIGSGSYQLQPSSGDRDADQRMACHNT